MGKGCGRWGGGRAGGAAWGALARRPPSGEARPAARIGRSAPPPRSSQGKGGGVAWDGRGRG
eukprot:9913325-Lingulodinium_polyedra.AAC.1